VADPALAGRLAEEGQVDQYIPDATVEGVALLLRRLMAGGG